MKVNLVSCKLVCRGSWDAVWAAGLAHLVLAGTRPRVATSLLSVLVLGWFCPYFSILSVGLCFGWFSCWPLIGVWCLVRIPLPEMWAWLFRLVAFGFWCFLYRDVAPFPMFREVLSVCSVYVVASATCILCLWGIALLEINS